MWCFTEAGVVRKFKDLRKAMDYRARASGYVYLSPMWYVAC